LLFFVYGIAAAQDNEPTGDSLSAIKELQEVIIKSQHKKQYADKAVYTFGKLALEKARYANDLLKSLPELQYDPISNSITSTKGGKTLFLVNGVEATELQIRGIRPANVLRVEYYDNPPTRYATRADVVVNIITRNPETGYNFGADASAAFTTGFLNGSAYANYNHGKSAFGLEYSINLRDYNNRKVESIYDYNLDGSHYKTNENKTDHFGYTYQDIVFRYTNLVQDKYAFQAKFNTEILTSFLNGKGGSIFTKDNFSEQHSMFKKGSSGYTIPTLDLYYSKNFGKKDELSLNLVGNLFTTKTDEQTNEWITATDANVFENNMNLKTKQTGLVGELAHTHSFTLGKWSSGYRVSSSKISNDLVNLEGASNYTVNYLTQYFYTEFSGKKNKLMYRAGLGLTNIHNKSAETVFDEWTPTPKMMVGYQIKDNQSLRLSSSYAPQSPWSSALSSNVTQIVPNIVQRGNPFLKSSKSWTNDLYYSLNNKYFDFTVNPFYNYSDRAINQYYVYDAALNGYALTYENAKFSQKLGVQISGSTKPFGSSVLVIKAAVTPATESVKTSSGALIKNNYIANWFVLSSEYKSFGAQYQFNIPVYRLNGAFLSTNENANHLFLTYKYKDFSFYTGMYWIGMPSDYKTKSLPESLVNYSVDGKIMNNKSMFILGLSFDFAKGKKTELNRKLNNSTAPAATF
jgi:hypothetical protein